MNNFFHFTRAISNTDTLIPDLDFWSLYMIKVLVYDGYSKALVYRQAIFWTGGSGLCHTSHSSATSNIEDFKWKYAYGRVVLYHSTNVIPVIPFKKMYWLFCTEVPPPTLQLLSSNSTSAKVQICLRKKIAPSLKTEMKFTACSPREICNTTTIRPWEFEWTPEVGLPGYAYKHITKTKITWWNNVVTVS